MDVTFVLEESGVTATVEVPCEADVAAAKEVACTALAVSPASVEMRIGTQVLEGTCRLQDTAFGAGVQVVLACPRLADIKCPAEYNRPGQSDHFSLSRCGTLCVYCVPDHFGFVRRQQVCGFDTETFNTAFDFTMDHCTSSAPAISRCKRRCYMAFRHCLLEVALPGGEVVRKVDGSCASVSACGGVVVSQVFSSVYVYDEDLTLLRTLSHEGCMKVAVSDCGGWVITSSDTEQNVRLWDVNTGVAVARVPAVGTHVALSRSASVFAVVRYPKVQLYDWSGAALRSFEEEQYAIVGMQFTPCGKYLVVEFLCDDENEIRALHQYDVATMSCVHVIQDVFDAFAISPCSRVVMFRSSESTALLTRHLYPY